MQQIILQYEELLKNTFSTTENPIFIEIGSERGHGSTEHHAHMCNKLNFKFITVDAYKPTTENAKKIAKSVNDDFEAYNMLGEDYLKQYDSKIHVLYLDAFDLEHMRDRTEGVVQSTRGSYGERGVALTNTNCYLAHLDMAKNAIDKMAENGIIFFDDVYSGPPEWEGKGKTAIPFLLEKGYKIIDQNTEQLILQKPNE